MAVGQRGRIARLMQRARHAASMPTLRNNAMLFGATAIVGVANYALNVTAVRTFPLGRYSEFGVVLNLLTLGLPVAGALSNVVTQRASYNRVRGDRDETFAVQRAFMRYFTALFAVGMLVLVLVREPLREFLRLTESGPIFLVALTLYWLFLQQLLLATIQEAGDYRRIAGMLALEGVFRGVVGVGVMVAGLGANVTLAVYMLSAALAAALLPRPVRFWQGVRVPFAAMRPLLRDMGPQMVVSGAFSIIAALDVLLCRRYLDPAVADRYVALAGLAKFFLALTSSVTAIAFVDVVKAAHRGETGGRPFALAMGLIAALAGPFILVCAVFGPLITATTLGEPLRESGQYLWGTAVTAFALALINLAMAYFNARQWFGFLPFYVLGGAGIVAALSLAGGQLPAYTGIYAAGAILLALLLLVPVTLGVTGRVRLGRNAPPPVRDAAEPTAVG